MKRTRKFSAATEINRRKFMKLAKDDANGNNEDAEGTVLFYCEANHSIIQNELLELYEECRVVIAERLCLDGKPCKEEALSPTSTDLNKFYCRHCGRVHVRTDEKDFLLPTNRKISPCLISSLRRGGKTGREANKEAVSGAW